MANITGRSDFIRRSIGHSRFRRWDTESYPSGRSTTDYRADVKGLLPKDKYLKPALDGLKGCLAVVQPNGAVAHVSKGTPVGRNVDFYKHIPRYPVPYGQSLVIVALVEWLRHNASK